MKSYFAFLLLIGVLASYHYYIQQSVSHQSYQSWKLHFGYSFKTKSEDIYRQIIYLKNIQEINKHNSQPNKHYEMGVNQFTALTQKQFVEMYLNDVLIKDFQESQNSGRGDNDLTQKNGEDVDWVKKGAVTSVKDQGQCGSSWAYGAVGALQGLNKIANNKLVDLSIQQIIDCTLEYGNAGCNGGWMDGAFKYVIDHGIAQQSQYPYVAIQQKCKLNGGKFKISSFTDVKSCDDLSIAILGRPIAIAADATNWYKYQSGVFDDCRSTPNHGVLLVGVREGNWVVKNTWGKNWGEDGYIRIAGGATCGICTYASYPNI